MTHKKQTIEVQLSRRLVTPLAEIAKLAGLSVESVIKLALATEVWRWQREQQLPPNVGNQRAEARRADDPLD